MNELALLHITDSAYCFPISENSIVIRLRTAKNDITDAWVLYESKYKIGEQHNKAVMHKMLRGKLYDYYSVTLTLEDTRLAYVFYLNDGKRYCYFSEDGITESYDFTKGYYNFFQYPFINKSDILPKTDWLSKAVFYQIFVDRFYKGNNEKDSTYINLRWGDLPTPYSFAGGDLKGIVSKLDYIRDLGCDALYLTPIFRSDSNHKYDIIDYFEIDPMFGDKGDLKRLVYEVHKRDMKLVLDAVFNHVSERNDKFQDAIKNGMNSLYYDWFVIKGDFPRKFPLNYEVFAECEYMPKWNTSNSDVQEYLISVALYYIKEFDIDGWRLDVSDEISHDFLRRFRKAVKQEKKDAVIIGENWHDASNYLRGDQYDSIMNYAFTKCALDYFAYGKMNACQAADKLNDLLARNTDTVNDMMLNLLDSHDTDRFYSEVSENPEKLHTALCLLFFYPGAPSVFYGTECYTSGGYDPDCRRCMDWESVNNTEKNTVTKLLQKLSKIKKTCLFSIGGTRIYSSADRNLLCVKRQSEKGNAALYINQSNQIGRDGDVQVQPGKYKIFVNGGEV